MAIDVSDRFRALVSVYSGMDVEFPHLKAVTIAQWMVESGRGYAKLFLEHNNAGGMKWREEMAPFGVSFPYMAHDGLDDYVHFSTLENFVRGYWRFIDRKPYEGWRAHVKNEREYISWLVRCGYCTDAGYTEKVLRLLPEAKALLLEAEDRKRVRVVLDAGHSNKHPGALSRNGRVREEVLNKAQAEAVQRELVAAGIEAVIVDREDDNLTLIGAAARGADLFVSFHHNSAAGIEGDPGVEVLFHSELGRPASKALAAHLSARIAKALGLRNRGAKGQRLGVLRAAEPVCSGPCVLIESYFVTNETDPTKSLQKSLVAAREIARVIMETCNAS